jgi:hypothetical protein
MKPTSSFQKPTSHSRRSMLKSTIVGVAGLGAVAGLAAGGVALTQQHQSDPAHAASLTTLAPDSIQTILNIAITAEHLAVTFYTQVLNNEYWLGFSDNAHLDIKAALIEEQLHALFLAKQGAKPLVSKFSFPHGKDTFRDFNHFIQTQQLLETLFVAAYIVAAKEFAMLKRPDLVQIAGQIGTVEAEHRVIGRAIGGLRPANNHVFSPIVVQKVSDAVTVLKKQGFLNPVNGNSFTYQQVDTNYSDVILRMPTDLSWS